MTINAHSTLSPGNDLGIIGIGNLNFANNSVFKVEIDDDNNSASRGGVAGTDYDQIHVTGTVTIGTNVSLDLQDLGSLQANVRDVYTIVSNDGGDAVTGTFAGLTNGAVVTAVGGIRYRIYYDGGDGNDIVLIGRPTLLTEVFVSTVFNGLMPGDLITDVDFLTAGDQSGIYGLDGYSTISAAVSGIDFGGTIHVDQGTYLHIGSLQVNKSVTIDGLGMNFTRIFKAGAPTSNFDESIRISADDVTFSDVQLGWQVHNSTDYQGYVVVTTADETTISRVLFGSNATGEGYRSAIVFEGTAGNSADGLEVSDSIFEGRWGRAAIGDGDGGSGENFLITRNEFREDHFRWGPIAIGPQDSAETPNNFAFSGEISFNYFGNGLDDLDFQSGGNQNFTVTITNPGLTSAGLDIHHNTFDWNDSSETNQNGVYAQPAGVYITPSLTANTSQILIQDNIFNNFAYAGPQQGTTDPPPVSGFGVVTPAAAMVRNNVFSNDVVGTYADSNRPLDPSNITGITANSFFNGDQAGYAGTTLEDYYTLRFGSSAAYRSTEFQADIATLIPHIGANQADPLATGTEVILVAGTDFDDLVVVTFTSENDGFFTYTRNVTGVMPDYVGTFNFTDITSFTFDSYSGDDVFIVIQPTAAQGGLFSLANGISFNGGLEDNDGNALDGDSATGGDTLVLLRSATDPAILDSAAYVFGSESTVGHNGTIAIVDGALSTIITFTGTEPIRDELSVNERTFSFASAIGGGTETITVFSPGDNVEMTPVAPIKPPVNLRTLDNVIQSTLGPRISFSNSNTLLTINAGSGDDVVRVDSLDSGFRSALTINGDEGNDIVNLNASLTLGDTVVGNTGNLTVTTETVDLTAGAAIDTTAETTGDGDVQFTADLNVTLNSGSSITTNTGFVIAATDNGSIDIDGNITTGSGNILLMTNNAGHDIDVAANILSAAGHITLMASESVYLGVAVNTQTGGTGTISIEASSGVVEMNSSSTLSSTDGDIRIKADGNVTFGNVKATNANAGIISAIGSVLDADADDSNVDVVAIGLRMQASMGIGTLGAGSNAIEITVTTLSARAGSGGVNILESNGLAINDVTVITQKVQINGSVATVTDAAQSDLRTTNNGSIVLRSEGGSLVLNDGSSLGDDTSIAADGTGNILIQTLASNGDVIVNSQVMAETGHITIQASDDIRINATVSSSGTGTVLLMAADGRTDSSGMMVDGINIDASIMTVDGDLLIRSTRDIRQSQIVTSQTGDIGLLASRDLFQGAAGGITTGADVLIEANRNWTMASDTVIFAGGGEVIGTASSGVLILGEINAAHVALTAGGDINDGNGTGLNVAAETQHPIRWSRRKFCRPDRSSCDDSGCDSEPGDIPE